jgi:hypothetical protein
MYISFANEGKTQVGWITIVEQKTWRWASANNTLPKGSPCCVLDLNEMTMKSMCLETSEKYGGDK